MKSLIVLVGMVAIAHADRFPDSGPCDDVEACEKACKTYKKGTCYWGGVLVMQSAIDETREARARALFERACVKGDADACWQVARLDARGDQSDPKQQTKVRASFQRACTKQHARGCFAYASLLAQAEDPKSKKAAADAQKKGMKYLEQRCTKQKLAKACGWLAELYGTGTASVPQDAKKAEQFRNRRCEIETGKPCPPPAQPAAAPADPFAGRPRRGGAD